MQKQGIGSLVGLKEVGSMGLPSEALPMHMRIAVLGPSLIYPHLSARVCIHRVPRARKDAQHHKTISSISHPLTALIQRRYLPKGIGR